jgi:hypothetical protein
MVREHVPEAKSPPVAVLSAASPRFDSPELALLMHRVDAAPAGMYRLQATGNSNP